MCVPQIWCPLLSAPSLDDVISQSELTKIVMSFQKVKSKMVANHPNYRPFDNHFKFTKLTNWPSASMAEV